MGRAAAGLDDGNIGPSTQQAEKNALARLALVLEAFKPDSPGKESGESGGDGGKGNQGPPGAIQAAAELKLFKLLQQQINVRTRQLQEAAVREPLTEPLRQEFSALAKEQGRLAELLLQKLQPAPQNPEDAPDQLPERPQQPPQEDSQ